MPCLLALISHWLFYQFTQIERTQSINFRKQCESVCSADFHRQCKKKKQYLVINSLKFDKLFILHSWINESLKINFEQRKKCGDTVKFLRKAIFFKISKTVCYNLVKKWGLQTQNFRLLFNHPCYHGNNPNLIFTLMNVMS